MKSGLFRGQKNPPWEQVTRTLPALPLTVVDVPKVHARGVRVIAAGVPCVNGASRQPVQNGILLGFGDGDGFVRRGVRIRGAFKIEEGGEPIGYSRLT